MEIEKKKKEEMRPVSYHQNGSFHLYSKMDGSKQNRSQALRQNMNKVLCRRVFNTSSGMALNMKRASESISNMCNTCVCWWLTTKTKRERERENHFVKCEKTMALCKRIITSKSAIRTEIPKPN